jgi:hypothetical protein
MFFVELANLLMAGLSVAHCLKSVPLRATQPTQLWGKEEVIVKAVRKGMLALTAAVALSIPAFACNNSARDTREDATEAQRDANEAQREADEKAQEARDKAREEAGDAARTGDSKAGAATETVDVKAALMADKTVDASNINVDTFPETRTVVLRGTVASEAQKQAAARIAQREAEGYKVDNLLVVTPRR